MSPNSLQRMHKSAPVVAVVALALALVVGFAACGSDNESEAYLEKCSEASDSAAGPNLEDPRSDRLAAEAVEIVENDPMVRELVGGREFSTPRQIPWSSGDSVGASGFVVTLSFEKPFSVSSTEWPLVVSPGAGRTNTEGVRRLLCKVGVEAANVLALDAYVNLGSGEIEQLQFTGPMGPIKGPHPEVRFEDFGDLPEVYTPVPGY